MSLRVSFGEGFSSSLYPFILLVCLKLVVGCEDTLVVETR